MTEDSLNIKEKILVYIKQDYYLGYIHSSYKSVN